VSDRAERWGAIAGCSGVAFVLAYVALRVAGAALYPEPNPAVVVSQARIAYFLRLQTSAYLAVLVALVLWVAPASWTSWLTRALPAAVAISAAALVAMSVLVP
jgi:hypothetical protein